jgi:hypothetical protein
MISQLICFSLVEFLHRAADLTLVPSVAIGRDLQAAHVTAGLLNHLVRSFIFFTSTISHMVRVSS